MPRASALMNLGSLVKLQGQLPEARRQIEEAREVASASVGRRHYFFGMVEAELAHIELREGAVEAARERIARALELMSGSLDEQSRELGRARVLSGEILLAANEVDAARSELERAVAGLERSLPGDSWQLAEARSLLGACLVEQGLTAEGLELLAGARDGMVAKLGASDPRARRAAARLEQAG